MRVKKLISFYEIQHFFQSSFRTLSPKLLIERKFSEFLCLLCKDSEKLVHFGSFNKIRFCTFTCVTGLGRMELTCESSVDYKKRDEAKSTLLHLFL